MTDSTPPRAAHHPPGYDEDNPYKEEDLSNYPEWWRQNIKEFSEHSMRPYRPPRFTDGAIEPEVTDELEEELGVSIRLRSIDPQLGNDWRVWIDGESVEVIKRSREAGGFSKYHIKSEEFRNIIRDAVCSH